ncbi:MAG: ferritin [Chloroflexi bacterium]|nr:ferritin [Chloroflexota bacterium]
MGKKGREIVKGDVSRLLQDLHGAYALEWVAHYNFMLAAHVAAGINAPVVAGVMRKSSEGELKHANSIAERIVQLGGEPIRDMAQLPARSGCPPFALPEEGTDLESILKAALELERHAIGFYQALADKTRAVDIVTHELAEELLADEVAEEEELENLLGRSG